MPEVKAWEVMRNYKPFDLNKDISDLTVWISLTPGVIYKSKEGEYYLKYTDYQVPVVSCNEKGYGVNYIYINEDYLINNYDMFMDSLINFINRYDRSKLKILATRLINDNVLRAIANNPLINMVVLGTENDPYVLTEDRFAILNKSDSLYEIETDLVSGEFSDDDKEFITWYNKKYLVESYTYQDLVNGNRFVINDSLNDLQIDYLAKCLKDEVNITFNYNDFNNILSVIESLKGKNISFFLNNLKGIENYRSAFKDMSNEEKIIGDKNIRLDKYIKCEEILDLMVKDIKDSNLSVFEKYLAVFNVVKNFKSYEKDGNEYSKNTRLSYDLYEILVSEYIVCKGYTNLFVDLLNRVGISAIDITVELHKKSEEVTKEDFAMYDEEELEVKMGNKEYHSRVMVRLIDEKYGIDGIYISDPTWDSSLGNDYYNFVAMTPFETNFELRTFYNTLSDIFNVSSGAEFYTKLKMFPDTIKYFLDTIKIIDKEFYALIDDKYDLDENKYSTEFFIDVYNYIITHTKKVIGKDVLYRAIEEVLKFIYDMNDLDRKAMLDQIEEVNAKRQDDFFPLMFKNGEEYANIDNKFRR